MSNDKKQTAVQMAFEKLAQQGLLVVDDYENLIAYQEAKAMEREQIKNAYKAGFAYRDTWQWEMDIEWDTDSTKENNEEFDNYYNETYKQQ
jgi:hypothetical protein